MSLSPELRQIPGIAWKFTTSGLTFEILRDIRTGSPRNLATDAGRLASEYEKHFIFNLEGLENIPSGGLIAFNHPSSETLFPAIMKLISEIKAYSNKEVLLVAASEIMLFSKFNDKISFPGSISFMKKLHGIYPDNIISAPTVQRRSDFTSGRALAARKVIRSIRQGNLVGISPEGHTEIGDIISPIETFHEGTGALASFAGKLGYPVVPISIWKNEKSLNIKISKSFIVTGEDNKENSISIMKKIAEALPQKLRGPFS